MLHDDEHRNQTLLSQKHMSFAVAFFVEGVWSNLLYPGPLFILSVGALLSKMVWNKSYNPYLGECCRRWRRVAPLHLMVSSQNSVWKVLLALWTVLTQRNQHRLHSKKSLQGFDHFARPETNFSPAYRFAFFAIWTGITSCINVFVFLFCLRKTFTSTMATAPRENACPALRVAKQTSRCMR